MRPATDTGEPLAQTHLRLWLGALNRVLRNAVARQRAAAARLGGADLHALCITDALAAALLDDVDRLSAGAPPSGVPFALSPEEQRIDDRLRQRAAAAGACLPLHQLVEDLGFTTSERLALVVVAATEVSSAYERLYAYVLDDLNRGAPSIELILRLAGDVPGSDAEFLAELDRFGRLRREGVIESIDGAATHLRQSLRLNASVLRWLLGGDERWLALRRDHGESGEDAAVPELPPHVDAGAVARLAQALRTRTLTTVGVWGPPYADIEDVVRVLVASAGFTLRRPSVAAQETWPGSVRDAGDAALAENSALWLEVAALQSANPAAVEARLVPAVAASRVPVVLSGRQPWRPADLLLGRSYDELIVPAPGFAQRLALWNRDVPELAEPAAGEIAARYRISRGERRAAATIARRRARASANDGDPAAAFATHLRAACRMLTARTSSRFAHIIEPVRGEEDLILTSVLKAQVLEVADFFAVAGIVDDDWGLGRLAAGHGGIKALFTGDPGTGKTLAAEVIARRLGLQLLKVDLAQIVSKWVGETEKNLESVFQEAEQSHAVLFFDEADTLFGKRGEVRHGTDRYANLEVGYLLQRLECFDGLVILASNLKDEIDQAFTRRFQIVLHFPRPAEAERVRLWRIAFPPTAPLDADVDFAPLVRLDLTGAGIVGSARMAALIAADQRSPAIGMRHVVEAIGRQYRQEGRLMASSDLTRLQALTAGSA